MVARERDGRWVRGTKQLSDWLAVFESGSPVEFMFTVTVKAYGLD